MAVLRLESGDDRAPDTVAAALKGILTILADLVNVLRERNIETMPHAVTESAHDFGVHSGEIWAAAKAHLATLERPVLMDEGIPTDQGNRVMDSSATG